VSTVLLGVGNPLMGDDGIGLEALRRLQARWVLPPDVDALDGGTWGMNLLHTLEGADRVVILDAIRSGSEPGTLTVLERDELPRLFSHKLSPHQIDLQEVLALAELRGGLPAEVVAVGIEPARVELGVGLSGAVLAGMDEMERRVVRRLEDWGVALEPRGPEIEPGDGVWRPQVLAADGSPEKVGHVRNGSAHA
jgi:hydrogenase maturation protease